MFVNSTKSLYDTLTFYYPKHCKEKIKFVVNKLIKNESFYKMDGAFRNTIRK